MLTQTLINVAVLVYFSISSGHGVNIDWAAGRNTAAKTEDKVVTDNKCLQYLDGPIRWQIVMKTEEKAAAKVEEKVMLRESSLSEKCGLGLETIARPDKEIVTLQSSASGLKSVLALGEKIARQTTVKLPVVNRFGRQWKDGFVFVWGMEDDGICIDGAYYRAQDFSDRICYVPRISGHTSFMLGVEPTRCLILSPKPTNESQDNETERGCWIADSSSDP